MIAANAIIFSKLVSDSVCRKRYAAQQFPSRLCNVRYTTNSGNTEGYQGYSMSIEVRHGSSHALRFVVGRGRSPTSGHRLLDLEVRLAG